MASAQAAPSAAAPAPAAKSATAAKSSKAAKKPAAQEFKLVVEPRAMELLKAMSAKLAAAKTLSFTATVGYEYPSKLGPPIVYTTRYDVTMQRPDKLRILMPGDGPASEFYYDGKTMIAYAPAENLAAVADAPPTIDAALTAAYQTAGIFYPFTDLIVADPYAPLAAGAKLAFYDRSVRDRRRDEDRHARVGRRRRVPADLARRRRQAAASRFAPFTGPTRCACGTSWSCRTGSSTLWFRRTRSCPRRRRQPDGWRSQRLRRRRK